MEHQALKELREIEKTKEALYNWATKYLTNIAFYFYSVYGFPPEMFDEEMEQKGMNNLEKITFIINFYKQNPKVK